MRVVDLIERSLKRGLPVSAHLSVANYSRAVWRWYGVVIPWWLHHTLPCGGGGDGMMARLLSSDGGTDTWIATDIGPTQLSCGLLSVKPQPGLCHMLVTPWISGWPLMLLKLKPWFIKLPSLQLPLGLSTEKGFYEFCNKSPIKNRNKTLGNHGSGLRGDKLVSYSKARERIDLVGVCIVVPFTEERSEVFGGEGICAGERSVCYTG